MEGIAEEILRGDQERYLKEALTEIPERLVEGYRGEEAAVEAALSEADEIFDATEEQWNDLLGEEASVRRMRASTTARALIWLGGHPEASRAGLVSISLGSGAFAYALLWPSYIGRLVGLELALIGSLWLIFPWFLTQFEAYFAASRIASRTLLRSARASIQRRWVGWFLLLVGIATYATWVLQPRPVALRGTAILAMIGGAGLIFVRETAGRSLLEGLQVAQERRSASRLAYIRALRSSALGRLRSRLGSKLDFRTSLHYTDFSGLAEIEDTNQEVSTATRDRLISMMELMPGGTIALSGPRGAGKSTLMRSVCAAGSTRPKQQEPLHVIVDAPVKYEARDFVLHLFARFCGAVAGRDVVDRLRGVDRLLGKRTRSGHLLADPQMLLALVFIVTGLVVTIGTATGVAIVSPLGWGIILVAAGYVLALSRMVSGRPRSMQAEVENSPDSDPNVHTAVQRMRQIWFQQSFSQGWSGGFKVPVGIEGGLSGSTEISEQQLSLPDIVDLFREFMGQVAEGREVRIGIDELDKMDDDSARNFLNELKVVFRVPDCFFFLSISEEAMSHFERRGLHVRDVFDSSLDAVIQVSHLQFAVSRELLELRIAELPLPFAALLHCLSGGLPRDLIRAARDLVGLQPGTPLTEAAASLLSASIRGKVDAARVVCRTVELKEGANPLAGWIDRVGEAELDPAELLQICSDFDAALFELDSDESPAHLSELRSLGVQLAAFGYYAATLLEFLAKFAGREFAKLAIFGDPLQSEEEPLVDQLAAASQALAVGIGAGWEMLTDFRAKAGLEGDLPFPTPSSGPGQVAAGRVASPS